MKKIIALCCLVFCLQGCTTEGGTTNAGPLSGDSSRSFATMSADDKISYLAEQLIVGHQELTNKTHIVVVSYNRVVLLAGQAATPAMRDQVVQIVQGVPNIKRIFNEITIGAPTTAGRRSKDFMVTTNVKARMLTTTNLKSSQFKVVTENGTVFLMGLATREQADIAASVTRNSTGVKRVVKLVEYVVPAPANNANTTS
jgi:osmotically-inducible protein OsmY